MNIIEKWNTIVDWQEHNLTIWGEDAKFDKELNKPITPEEITIIEQLLGETLPDVFKQLYSNGNGQPYDNYPLLFGETFMSSDEIIKELKYTKSLVKPEIQKVENPKESQVILEKIVKFCVDSIPHNDSWFQMKFSCSKSSITGPSLYKNEETGEKEKESFDIDIYEFDFFLNLVRDLHKLEYECYNWDELLFTVYSNGKFEVERKNFNLYEMNLTSTPENAIKKKNINHKWLPIFVFNGGNFIGIDMDPDVNGKKGQIINFGAGTDEDDKFVIADNLEQLFDLIITGLNKNNGESFRTDGFLIDIMIKDIKNKL